MDAAPNNGTSIAQISAALAAGDTATALRLCRIALTRSPRDPRLWSLRAIAQGSSGQPNAAEASYTQALRIAPTYAPALQGLAQLQYSMHEPAAQRTLERLVALAPGDTLAHAMLGALAFGRKDCSATVRELGLAGPTMSQRSDVALPLASCLLQLNRASEAAGVLRSALQAQPDNPTLRYDAALAEWRAGDADAAQRTIEPLTAGKHATSDALTLGAEIAETRNDTQKALELLRAAVLTNPKNRDAYLDFARLAYDHASVQVGIDMVDLGLKNLPEDAELYFARGVLEAQNGKMDQTMADLQRASELDPKLAFVGTAQGIAASQAHQFANAEQKLLEQTRLHPTDATAWYLLAEALSSEQIEPGSARHAEMVHAAETAARLNPRSAEAHSQLASIYLRDGDAAQAIAECNAALKVNPNDPQTLYQLLLATRKAGNKDELPTLVKRLMAAREAAEAADKSNRKQMLVEVPATRGNTNLEAASPMTGTERQP